MRARVTLPIIIVSGVLLSACASTPDHEEIQSTFQAGLKAYDAGDYTTAYQTWQKIENDDLAAMRNIAVMLRKGQGVKKDPQAAQDMMTQAAEAGVVTAEADLGEMLLNGEAGPPDPKSASIWLAQAAEAGHPIAAFELGELYEQGTAIQKDLEKARRLYQFAAAKGVPGAAEKLAALPPGAPPQLRH